jgi:hypothetical protein
MEDLLCFRCLAWLTGRSGGLSYVSYTGARGRVKTWRELQRVIRQGTADPDGWQGLDGTGLGLFAVTVTPDGALCGQHAVSAAEQTSRRR